MWLDMPFSTCPSCKNKCFGQLLILCNDIPILKSMCKACQYSNNIPTPILDKKIIYLDQFFFSQCYTDPRLEPIIKKLEGLYKLNLIICPSSSFHEEESLPCNDPITKQRQYEKLSGEVKLFDPISIYNQEIVYAFLRDLGISKKQLTIHDITYGTINRWLPRFLLSNSLEKRNASTQSYKETRAQKLSAAFGKYQGQKGKQYKEIFQELIAEEIATNIKNIISWERFLKPYLQIELPKPQISALIKDFLERQVAEIPSVKVMSANIAEIAFRIANYPQTKPLNDGTFNDLNIMASILPYADAIFIDKEQHERITRRTHAALIIPEYQTKVFSVKNITNFLEYLEKIDQEANERVKIVSKAIDASRKQKKEQWMIEAEKYSSTSRIHRTRSIIIK